MLNLYLKKNFAFWQEVMSEDVAAIEGMQRGRSSPAYNGFIILLDFDFAVNSPFLFKSLEDDFL